jgi:hypothetical protein
VLVQEIVEAARVELVGDRADARRLLRMARTHLVQSAGRMRNEGDGHEPTPFAVSRDEC